MPRAVPFCYRRYQKYGPAQRFGLQSVYNVARAVRRPNRRSGIFSRNPLQQTAQAARISVVGCGVDRRAEAGMVPFGRSALHKAAEALRMLIQRGTDVFAFKGGVRVIAAESRCLRIGAKERLCGNNFNPASVRKSGIRKVIAVLPNEFFNRCLGRFVK